MASVSSKELYEFKKTLKELSNKRYPIVKEYLTIDELEMIEKETRRSQTAP